MHFLPGILPRLFGLALAIAGGIESALLEKREPRAYAQSILTIATSYFPPREKWRMVLA